MLVPGMAHRPTPAQAENVVSPEKAYTQTNSTTLEQRTSAFGNGSKSSTYILLQSSRGHPLP